MFLGPVHFVFRSSDGDFVASRALVREVNVNATALIHDGTYKTSLGTNEPLVMLGRDGDFNLCDVGLVQKEEKCDII